MQEIPAMTQVIPVFNLARMSSIHARIKQLRESLSMSMEGLADAIGVSWQTVQQWENGKTAPKRKRLEDVAEVLKTTVDFLMTGGAASAESEEFVSVKRVDVRLSAGRGTIVFSEDEKSRLSFRRDFLSSSGANPDNVVSAVAHGESMSPTIPNGAVVLLNLNDKGVTNKKVYAFRMNGNLHIKRLAKDKAGDIIAKSDNPEYEDMNLSTCDEPVEIIGRAFWMGVKL